MNEENDKILELDDGKCVIKMNKDGSIKAINCPNLELGTTDIDMVKKIKDIVTEDEI